MCFFFGGLKYDQQNFNQVAAQTSASLLALSVLSLMIPAAFNASINNKAVIYKHNISYSYTYI